MWARGSKVGVGAGEGDLCGRGRFRQEWVSARGIQERVGIGEGDKCRSGCRRGGIKVRVGLGERD